MEMCREINWEECQRYLLLLFTVIKVGKPNTNPLVLANPGLWQGVC
jgi:hypothetical protein